MDSSDIVGAQWRRTQNEERKNSGECGTLKQQNRDGLGIDAGDELQAVSTSSLVTSFRLSTTHQTRQKYVVVAGCGLGCSPCASSLLANILFSQAESSQLTKQGTARYASKTTNQK